MGQPPPCKVPSGEVVTGAQWHQQYPSWLYRGIAAGALDDRGAGGPEPHVVRVVELGTIDVPDGRLVACDPYVFGADQAAFTQQVPAGAHEVSAAIATIGPDHERVAAGLIAFSSAPIVRWAPAVLPGEDPGPPIEQGAFTGYPVDAGTGCFASLAALPALSDVLCEDAGMLEDPLSLALEEAPEAVVAQPRPGALPVAVFHSGWGDGVYPTWFGHAADDVVVLAITDFLSPDATT